MTLHSQIYIPFYIYMYIQEKMCGFSIKNKNGGKLFIIESFLWFTSEKKNREIIIIYLFI